MRVTSRSIEMPRPRAGLFVYDWLQILRHQEHTIPMAKPGDILRIPLQETEFLSGLMKVKPTSEMPRPGAHPTIQKTRKRRKPKAKKV
jgi:hypothetical protein